MWLLCHLIQAAWDWVLTRLPGVLHGVFGCHVPKNETQIVHYMTYKSVCLQEGRKTSRMIAMNGYSHFEKYLLYISLSTKVAQLIIDLHIIWSWNTEIACIYDCLAKIQLCRYCLNNSLRCIFKTQCFSGSQTTHSTLSNHI